MTVDKNKQMLNDFIGNIAQSDDLSSKLQERIVELEKDNEAKDGTIEE